MRVNERMKKWISMALCLCMLVQNCPVMAFAATTDNLCDHHTEHTAECGYREGSAGSACTHEHSEGCYKIVACKHTHDDTCSSGCSHTCTVENGCIIMELDCHHTHGDCGYAEAVAPQECTTCQPVLTHAENCGYVAPVAEVTCACVPGEGGTLVHTEGCGYVAPVEEVKCACVPTVTHGGEGCTYAEGKDGSPCTHVCEVKVDSAEGCYKLLCSHKDGGHDDACGYVAQSEGSPCTYTCQEDHGMVPADPVCSQLEGCTEDAHVEGCALYVAPSDPVCTCEIACGKDNGINPNCTVCLEDFWLCNHFDPTICSCAEKCTEETVNYWCPVCSEGIAGCGGTDSAAVFAAASVPTVDTDRIYANGTPLYIEAGTTSGTAVYYMSGSQKVYVNTNRAAGNDLSNTIIWGGYNDNALDGDVNITMTGGQIKRINGSGWCASDTSSGYVNNVNITITGGTVSDDINAGWRNPVKGNVNITMTGGSVDTIYGCCSASQESVGNTDVKVHGNVNITVTGGTVSQIHGGDGKHPVNGTVSGLITVPVSFLNNSTLGNDFTVRFNNLLYKNGSNYIHRGTVTIPAGVTMTAAVGETLTIPANATLINNGTLVNNGTITINGVLRNNGSLVNNGTVNRNAAYITTASSGTPSVWANGSAVSGAATEYVDGKLYIYGVTGNIKATLNGQTYYGCQSAGTATELTTGYVCVTDIAGIPEQIDANKAVPLQAVLTPENTTLPQTISYEVVNDGGTGAVVSGNTLTAYGGGTVTLRVKATDSYSPCMKEFSITVNFVPVTGLSAAVPSYPGTHTLPGVAPANASYQSIVWTLVDAGVTGATLSGDKLTIQNAGTLKLSCVVKNGLAYGTDYTKDFTITVEALDYVDISQGSVTITQKDAQTLTVAYNGFVGGSREYAVGQPIPVTGSSTNQHTISVESGVATILLDNCSISYHAYSDSPLSVASGAVLHLKLSGNNSLTHTSNAIGPITKNAALRVPSGATLTIDGDGSLEATGGAAGAGIGGGDEESCGTITINGGTITATSSDAGAGIGGGNDGSGGTITINGGIVTATVSRGVGAGIGSGDEGSGGTITINGGTVSATAYRSPIGANSGTAANVKITGGSVYAYSINKYAPISATPTDGNGNPLTLNTITLDGVTAPVAVTAVEEMPYGLTDVYTRDNNKLYFYLPENTAATSITAGGVEYICNRNLTYYTSHGELVDATCSMGQHCAECGCIFGEPLGHNYVDGICTVCRLDENGVYHICTAEQLVSFATLVNEGNTTANAILEADIDLSNHTWTPIGVTAMGEGVTDGYTGTFDGQGHVISNITFATPTSALAVGIFGTVQSGGTVKNLGVENLTFDNNAYDHRAGGIAGQLLADSTISDCYVINSTVKASSRVVGGIVGMNNGTVQNCYTYNMTLAGYNNRFGGISGDYTVGKLENCYTDYSALASSQAGTATNCEAGVSAERFASGEIAYKLNGSKSEGDLVWGQKIGEDAYPVLGGDTVYYDAANGYNNHVHNWEYTVDGNKISASCNATGCFATNGGSVTLSAENVTYDGTAQETASVTYNGWNGGELTVSYANNVNAGTATASITVGEATASVDFTIAKATPVVTPPTPKVGMPYTNVYFSLTDEDATTTGGELMYKVNDGEWSNITVLRQNWSAGTYKIYWKVVGDENYESVDTGEFTTVTILQQELDKINPTVTLSSESFVYDGAAKTSVVSIVTNLPYTDHTGSNITGTTVTLEKDKDFTVTYSDNVNAGTATVTIQGIGNFKGTVTRTFAITKAPLTVTADNKTMTTGQNLPTFTYTITGFVNGETEDVLTTKPTAETATDGQTAGTYEITVSGAAADNYDFTYVKGTLTVVDHQHAWTYTAEGDTITAICGNGSTCPEAEQTITICAEGKIYDGKPVTAELDGSIEGVDDPEITYSGNTDAGTYTASIKLGKATASVEFTIEKATPTVAWANTSESVNYTGVAAVITAPSVTLVNGEPFGGTISYAYTGTSSGSGLPTNAGTYEITASIDAQGSYNAAASTNKLTLTINKVDPVYTVPTGLTATYGDTLADVALPEGFRWTDSSESVGAVGTKNTTVIYTPADTANYNTVTNIAVSVAVKAAAATVTAAPTPNDLTYTGEAQELITAGEAEGGTMQYQLNGGEWSDKIPTAKDEGTYTVSWKVVGDANHADTEVKSITVTIGDCTHSGNTNRDDADCTTQVTCSVCGDVLVEAKAHVWADWTTTLEPTTTTEGSKERLCTNDGCEAKDTKSIPMLNEVEVPKPEGGDVSVDNPTPATGEDVTITVTPDTGKEVVDVVVRDKNDNEITVTKNEDGTYTYEQPDSDVTVEVILKDTIYTVTWTVDGKTYAEQTYKYGEHITAPADPTKAQSGCTVYTFHKWNGFTAGMTMPDEKELTFAAEFTEEGSHIDDDQNHICDRECGKTEIGLHADAADDKDHVCDYGCGEVLETCSGGTATCMAEAVCAVCGESYGSKDPQNHTGSTHVENAEDPTCAEPGYTGDTVCECGETIGAGEQIPATGEHDYHNGTCSVCGGKDPNYNKPGWGGIWDWIFGGWWGQGNKCDHSYTAVVTAPTCTEKGYTTYTCSKCGDCYKDSYTNALGHAWDDGKVTKEPTCTEDGVKTYTCGRCGHRKTETIQATGHNYQDGICGGCGAQKPTEPSVPDNPDKPNKPVWGGIWDWICGGWWK